MGLLLLGMRLLTEGLRVAAGSGIRDVLARSTRTPLRGILSGAGITALAQSSSAVTVATIGFVNAGLLSLAQAVAVVYGSNVGTTVTGWLVALIGFQVDVKAFALPGIGLGMLLHLLGRERRLGAGGEALAGFGLFFLGIDLMKAAMDGFGAQLDLTAFGPAGVLGIALFLGVGFLLTLAMQSSSAALTLALSAAAGGVVPMDRAAAMVIGANLGTTSTASLVVIGATANAKRVAAAHVAFNGITGLVALVLLPVLLAGLATLQSRLGLEGGEATALALFHTTFNVLGVLLLWPLTGRLVRFLETRFRTREEDEARTRYLDRAVLATPALAVNALILELARVGGVARRMALAALSDDVALRRRLAADRETVERLVEQSGDFASAIQRAGLLPDVAEALPRLLRVARYDAELAELAVDVAEAATGLDPLKEPELREAEQRFREAVAGVLERAGIEVPGYAPGPVADELAAAQTLYQELKAGLLRAGTDGRLPVRAVVGRLDALSNVRRMAEQAERAGRFLASVAQLLERGPAAARPAAAA